MLLIWRVTKIVKKSAKKRQLSGTLQLNETYFPGPVNYNNNYLFSKKTEVGLEPH